MDDHGFPADRVQRDGTADGCTGSVIRGTRAVGAAGIEPLSGGLASPSAAQPCYPAHHHGPGG